MADINDAAALLKVTERLHAQKDMDILLENILHEARVFVNADAGTLYQLKDGQLYFAYIENETLFRQGNQQEKHVYTTRSIPVNNRSIAGFVAQSGQSLLIDDVYALPEGLSYAFNPEFDRKSNYHTRSIMAVPLKNSDGHCLGVIQLINAMNEAGEAVPFSQQHRLSISLFAQHAALAMEKVDFAKQMIMRLVEVSQLRDPHETQLHAQRVGEYAAALFDEYAIRQGTPLAQRNRGKEALRLAAILHDIGKVGIDPQVLSKGEQFTDEDRRMMVWHTIYGARLFHERTSVWDRVAFEVTLRHHERWDGRGYPGNVSDLFSPSLPSGPGLKGKNIPLSARIAAIADVFDALVSKRSYKEAWSMDTAMSYLKNKAGREFDPELVELFISIRETIESIFERWQDRVQISKAG
jgi:HD-GYP domain-containing protein (c-di-GMP phosphodiesterase class II)